MDGSTVSKAGTKVWAAGRKGELSLAVLDRLVRVRSAHRSGMSPRPRPFGTMRGEIWMAADFDDTPENLIMMMEGESEPASPM